MDIIVLVVIALKEEFDVFLEDFPLSFSVSQDYEGLQQGKYKRNENDGSLTIYVHCIFDMTSIESFEATSKWIGILTPDIVLSIGIAGGLWDKKDMSLGDVIIVQSATEVAHKGKAEKGSMIPGGLTENSDDSLGKSFKILANQHSFDNKLKCRVMFGPIATTPYVVADDIVISSILSANRNFHAVDMEAYGVGRATNKSSNAKFWAVKGVSDYADKNKSILEATTKGCFRRQAMENAVSTSSMLLEQVTGQIFNNKNSHVQGLTDLEKRFRIRGNREVFDALKRGGDDRIHCEEYLNNLIEDCSIEELIEYVTSDGEDKSLSVSGQAGGGVTSVLTGVGVKLMEKGLSVFYVNLKEYTLRRKDASIDLDIIRKIHTYQPDIFIMDGWDGSHENRKLVAESIQAKIGAMSITIIYGFRNDGFHELFPPAIDYEVLIAKLDAKWVRTNKMAIETVCQPRNAELFWRQIESLKYLNIDPFILHAIASRSFANEFEFIKNYCGWSVNHLMKGVSGKWLEKIINKASAIAYSHFKKTTVNLEDDEDDDDDDDADDHGKVLGFKRGLSVNNALACDLAFSHESVSNFLVANHVINIFLLWEKDKETRNLPEVPEVFPQTVNRFCKAIIQSDIHIQRVIVSAISNILDSDVHPYMKAHGCYLLGRVNERQLKEHAAALLEKTTRNPTYVKGEDKPILMVGRSAYISMTYLEKESMAIEYVDKLFEKDSWDMLNRGFHLEYYGDRSYDPSRPLESMDDLKDWEKTYSQLTGSAKRLKKGVANIVDIHTLFSLAFHRHKSGCLQHSKKTELIILGRDIAPMLCRYENLKRYVNRCVDSMESGNDPDVRIFTERYSLQFRKRTGFTSRGLLMGQSIADHIYGSVAIAEHYLKDVYDGINAYSKERVVNLVSRHDDGEGRSGDYDPNDAEKFEKMKLENEYFQDLRLMLCNYSSYRDHPMLWEEFKTAESINAKIARNIDKIENYLCLRVYQSLGFEPNDIDEWIKDLESSLTGIGDVVYQQIKHEECEIVECLKLLFKQNDPLFIEQWNSHIQQAKNPHE